MKKIVLNVLSFILLVFLFSSCKVTKKGCGLTSDAQKIQQIQTEKLVIAEIK